MHKCNLHSKRPWDTWFLFCKTVASESRIVEIGEFCSFVKIYRQQFRGDCIKLLPSAQICRSLYKKITLSNSISLVSAISSPSRRRFPQILYDTSALVYLVSDFIHCGWRVCTHIIECDSKSKQPLRAADVTQRCNESTNIFGTRHPPVVGSPRSIIYLSLRLITADYLQLMLPLVIHRHQFFPARDSRGARNLADRTMHMRCSW